MSWMRTTHLEKSHLKHRLISVAHSRSQISGLSWASCCPPGLKSRTRAICQRGYDWPELFPVPQRLNNIVVITHTQVDCHVTLWQAKRKACKFSLWCGLTKKCDLRCNNKQIDVDMRKRTAMISTQKHALWPETAEGKKKHLRGCKTTDNKVCYRLCEEK